VPPITTDSAYARAEGLRSEPRRLYPGRNVFVRGIHRTGDSNWRLAVENGFDPGHILIHYDNVFHRGDRPQAGAGMAAERARGGRDHRLPTAPRGS